MMYRQAVQGDCSNPDLVRENAVTEFNRMAEAADKWNAHCKAQVAKAELNEGMNEA
jgi:hypothetical protein